MILLYELKRKKRLDKIFEKLAKKDTIALEAIQKKTKQIIKDPYRFKPLSNKMKNIRRVHIKAHFVLTYKIIEQEKIVELLDYDHHDKIYKNWLIMNKSNSKQPQKVRTKPGNSWKRGFTLKSQAINKNKKIKFK